MSAHEEIDALTHRYLNAFRNKDAQECADCYTEDAVYVACGSQPIRGRAAIRSLHESILDDGFQILKMETTEIEVSQGLAYILQTLQGNKGNSIALLVLRCEEKGQWRVCAESEVS